MQCEKCPNDAVLILNAGSLGRVERLCANCKQRECAPLDAGLIPYTTTGLDASLSAAESITQDLKQVVQLNKSLTDEVFLLQTQNQSLRDQLLATLKGEKERLSLLHDQLTDENLSLQEQLHAQQQEQTTRVD